MNNISNLPEKERRDIELQRQASLVIRDFKRGKISREDVKGVISKLSGSEQIAFREHLNYFKAMYRGSR